MSIAKEIAKAGTMVCSGLRLLIKASEAQLLRAVLVQVGLCLDYRVLLSSGLITGFDGFQRAGTRPESGRSPRDSQSKNVNVHSSLTSQSLFLAVRLFFVLGWPFGRCGPSGVGPASDARLLGLLRSQAYVGLYSSYANAQAWQSTIEKGGMI